MFICPLPTFPEFHSNPFGSFWAKLLTNGQTDRQTDKQPQKHILLGGGNDSDDNDVDENNYISVSTITVVFIFYLMTTS